MELEEFSVYIQGTPQCQLRCPGCNALPISREFDFLQSGNEILGKLTNSISEIAQYVKTRNGKSLHIKWAGGEPTVGRGKYILLNIQDKLRDISQKHKIEIRQTILSNGLSLKGDILKIMKQHNINAAVSVWGWGWHNFQERLRKDIPQRMYELMWKQWENNVSELTKHGINWHVWYVITPSNAKYVKDAINEIWNNKGKFHNSAKTSLAFGIWRPQNRTLSPKEIETIWNDGVETILKWLIKKIIDDKETMHQAIGTLFDYLRMNGSLLTCGAGDNYVALRYDDSRNEIVFAKCHEGLWSDEESNNLTTNISKDSGLAKPVLLEWKADITPERFLTGIVGGGGCPRDIEKFGTNKIIPLINLYDRVAPILLMLAVLHDKAVGQTYWTGIRHVWIEFWEYIYGLSNSKFLSDNIEQRIIYWQNTLNQLSNWIDNKDKDKNQIKNIRELGKIIKNPLWLYIWDRLLD